MAARRFPDSLACVVATAAAGVVAAIRETNRAMKTIATIFDVLVGLKWQHQITVMEIGAADGGDTMNIMRATESDHYFAFEPDPRNLFSFKASYPSVFSGITLVPCAVGNRNAIVPFNVCTGYNENLKREHTFSGSLKKPVEHLERHPWCKFENQIDVRMIRLDDFCQLFSIPPLSLIWCDVQGAEDLVIEGAKNALSSCQYFYTEYYDTKMYDGQLTCAEIHNRLPGKWKIVEKWEDNVLFENVT